MMSRTVIIISIYHRHKAINLIYTSFCVVMLFRLEKFSEDSNIYSQHYENFKSNTVPATLFDHTVSTARSACS
jgi:hypothetical protein